MIRAENPSTERDILFHIRMWFASLSIYSALVLATGLPWLDLVGNLIKAIPEESGVDQLCKTVHKYIIIYSQSNGFNLRLVHLFKTVAWLREANSASVFSHAGLTGSIHGQAGLETDHLLWFFTAVRPSNDYSYKAILISNVSIAYKFNFDIYNFFTK